MTRKVLGAILAGGRALRFGGDKAAALLEGVPLIEHVARALGPQVAALVVVGRDWPGLERVEDRPAPGLGPLGGLAGALAYAAAHGFDAVLTAGCDMPGLPADLLARLGAPNAVAEGQPLLGLWDAGLADRLAAHLSGEDRSIRRWAREEGAREVALPTLPRNINRPEDLLA